MDATQLFFERYDGFREYPERVVLDLSEDQMRRTPHDAMNPIAWTLWHMARCEDLGVHRLVCEQPQVFDREDWPSRLGIETREMGTAMTKAEVAELSAQIDLTELARYQAAVSAQTEAAVRALPSSEWSALLSDEVLHTALFDEGAGGRVAEGIHEAYSGHSKGWLLGHLGLTHNYYHVAQAFSARTMLGAPSPW